MTAAPTSTLDRIRQQFLGAFRHRNYRLFWIGMLVSLTGYWIQYTALLWLVLQLSGAPLALGFLGASQAVPTIVLSLFGGVLADRLDRRKVLLVTQGVSGVLFLVAATLAVAGLATVPVIYAVSFAFGAVWAFDQPSRQALLPHLVAKEDLANAIAMFTAVWQVTGIVGPMVGGVLITAIGAEQSLYLPGLGFLFMVAILFAINVTNVGAGGTMRMGEQTLSARIQGIFRDLGRGVGFIVRSPTFSGVIGLTFFSSIFGMSFVMLLPIFAQDILEAGPEGFGALNSARAIGGLFGIFAASALAKSRLRGWAFLGGELAFGGTLVLFALSPIYELSLLIMVISGAFNFLYLTVGNTLLQSLVPDELRGRVMGMYGLLWTLMPLGGMISGGIAQISTAPFAVAVGGALVMAFVLASAIRLPQVRNI